MRQLHLSKRFNNVTECPLDTLTELKEKGHQQNALPKMLTRAELYDFLDYKGFEERDRKFSGG